MGNVVALDMGIIILRCAIFDKNNELFPHKIYKEQGRTYFIPHLSFYSVEHGGTFHFLQFNIGQSQKVSNI